MKYKTKQKRLCAIADAYLRVHSKSSLTTDEVAAWVFKHDLFPVPSRRDPADVCEDWEARFEKVLADAGVTP